MISLVIVSHSARLADGVAELAREMAGSDVQIATAGGLDMPDRPLGTDAALVMRAIEAVYSEEGVLVLADMGSALLSAEFAIDMLDSAQQTHILLCDAPLVEGAVAAAVQARIGGTLDQAAQEARSSLTAKQAHLSTRTVETTTRVQPTAGQKLTLTVGNRLGLHARPAARLVQTIGVHASHVTITNLSTGQGPVNAKSINGIATLGVRQGHQVEFTINGPDAAQVLAAIRTLADQNFGDPPDAATVPNASETVQPDVEPGLLRGIGASGGIAIGTAFLANRATVDIDTTPIDDPMVAWKSLSEAIERVRIQIRDTLARVTQGMGHDTAAIFEAHLLYLEDEALLEPAHHAIFEDHLNPGAAWQNAVNALIAQYTALDDPYLRARAADLRDVGDQVLVALTGKSSPPITLTQPGILVIDDLTPADTAHLDSTRVLGIVCVQGSATSHSAILARALGIPAVVGLGGRAAQIGSGRLLILDGNAGTLRIDPDAATLTEFTAQRDRQRANAERALVEATQPAVTQDGRRVEIAANIGSVKDAQQAVDSGAEAVGLFRTEFLFLDRQVAPTEEEQLAAYRAAGRVMDGRPMIIRTLDVGGDKPLPYIDQGREPNPFLGWRAIRLCLSQPELFKTQLRAIVRTAAEFPIRVMFPMIAIPDELRSAKALLAAARAEVIARGQPALDRIETGIMIEIPAAAITVELFASEVDFFSIGTNDLTQYTLAAERGNPRVAYLADALQPAVVRLIGQVVETAHRYGKWVGVCGELAGDASATALLVGLGIDELSMNAPAIPQIKQIVRGLSYTDAARIAAGAKDAPTADAVRNLFNKA
jgi:phosphocarrier protein FPr